jgi:hypothetical protein
MKIRYDIDSDAIEFILKEREGSVRPTASPNVMEKVDAENNIIGFSILRVSVLKKQGQNIELLDVPQPAWTDFKLWYEMKS